MREIRKRNSKSIRRMFDSLSERYDLVNDLLSLGMHRLWKRKLVHCIPADTKGRWLDLATGTGDLALMIQRRFGVKVEVVGVDYAPRMLDRAKEKSRAHFGDSSPIRWILADSINLPFPDQSLVGISVSFGLRNFSDRAKAFQEMKRVLKKGAHVLILEFGNPIDPNHSDSWIKRAILTAVAWWTVRLGAVLSGRKKYYQYLQLSSDAFPGPDGLRLEVTKYCGWRERECLRLWPGNVFLYHWEV